MTLASYLAHVATVYANHRHEPDNVTVRHAYARLTVELCEQYHTVSRGLTLEHTDVDPYPTSATMFEDITRSRRLRVYTGATLPVGHPMLVPVCGHTVNDVFRAVHDALAHYPGRHGFGPRGEYRAYLAHCTFLSPMARWAVATETLAQFASYYYGPNPRTYAPQHATLLPRDLLDNVTLEDI